MYVYTLCIIKNSHTTKHAIMCGNVHCNVSKPSRVAGFYVDIGPAGLCACWPSSMGWGVFLMN